MSSNRRHYYSKPRWEVEKEEAERARREKQARDMEDTEENFPSIGKVTVKAPTWGGRSFSALATDWKRDDEEKKEEEDRRKQNTHLTEDGVFLLPRFTPSNRFVEDNVEVAVEETKPNPPVEEDDESGWVTVDHNAKKQARKLRKERRKEEQIRRMDEGEEPESSETEEEEQDESCWNDKPPEHETCWDDRRP